MLLLRASRRLHKKPKTKANVDANLESNVKFERGAQAARAALRYPDGNGPRERTGVRNAAIGSEPDTRSPASRSTTTHPNIR
jgi:hypothetical protein